MAAKKHQPGCPCCDGGTGTITDCVGLVACLGIIGDVPSFDLEVEYAGFVNGTCSDAAYFNDAFILTPADLVAWSNDGSTCFETRQVDGTGCDGALIESELRITSGVPAEIRSRLLLTGGGVADFSLTGTEAEMEGYFTDLCNGDDVALPLAIDTMTGAGKLDASGASAIIRKL